VEGFTDYLKNTAYRDDLSYFEHLAENEDAKCDPDLKGDSTCWEGLAKGQDKFKDSILKSWPELEQDSFQGDRTYAVTFMRRGLSTCEELKERSWYQKFISAYGVTNPAGADYLLDQYLTYSVQLIPADNIHSYCDAVIV
jgi:hypothetical protein